MEVDENANYLLMIYVGDCYEEAGEQAETDRPLLI